MNWTVTKSVEKSLRKYSQEIAAAFLLQRSVPHYYKTMLSRTFLPISLLWSKMDDHRKEYASFLLFGIPTWALVDGTWASLSQLASHTPEGYSISAYLILALTLGNVFPLVVGHRLRSTTGSTLAKIIRYIQVIGFLAGVGMAALWNVTISVGGSSLSLPLLILFFIVGACSSTSNVTHFTLVSAYAASSTSALATGMGVGSMIAGLWGILQGLVLSERGVSVSWTYALLALLYIPAYVCFVRYIVPESMPHPTPNRSVEDDAGLSDLEQPIQTVKPITSSDGTSLLRTPSTSTAPSTDQEYNETAFLREYAPVLLLQMLIAGFGYGVVPAIISYASGKFKHSTTVLLFSTGTAAVVDPWFRALTNVARLSSLTSLWIAGGCLVCLAAGLLLCAALPSSMSVFQTDSGGSLPVLLYVTFMALFGYTNTCVFRYLKALVPSNHVQHGYRWSGMALQSGALVGSVIAFALVVSGSL